MSKFADRLKEARLAKGLTEQEVADKLHVTRQAVNNWERGINYPDVELIPKIAELLDIDLGFLLSGEVKPPEVKYVEKPVYYRKKLTYQNWMNQLLKRAVWNYKVATRVMAPIFFVLGIVLLILSLVGVIKDKAFVFSGIGCLILSISIFIFGLSHYKIFKKTREELSDDMDDDKKI